MKYGVSSNTLLLLAGAIWLAAGANILRIGIVCWSGDHDWWLLKVAEASFVFLLFFALIFNRLFIKHTGRIAEKRESKQQKHCPFSFFDTKGWIIMAVMITMGITIRRLELLPVSFIAVFYTGLSLALMATGVRFLIHAWRVLKKEE